MVYNIARIALHIDKGKDILRRVGAQSLRQCQCLRDIAVNIMVSYDRLITDISIIGTGRSQLIAVLVLITNLIGYLIALDSIGHHIIHVACHCNHRTQDIIRSLGRHILIITATQTEALYVIFVVLRIDFYAVVKFVKKIDTLLKLKIS